MTLVEKDHNAHLVSTPFYVQGHQPPAQAAQSHIQPGLNASRDGASTTSLANLFQCITTLFVKNFLLTSNLNLPYLSLRPFSFVLSLSTFINSHSPSCLNTPFTYWKDTMRSPWSLPFFKLNNPTSLNLSSQERFSSCLIICV